VTTTNLEALRTSVQRLRGIVEPLDDSAVGRSAYPTEWTIAQVMSHIGSSAVIFQRRIEDELVGTTTSDDFAPSVWDEWNAKTPRAQVADGLAADAALLAALDALSDDQRNELTVSIGPITVDFDGYVGLRLNEHALHTWDIDVALDSAATIPESIAALVVDHLDLISRFTAQPTDGDPATITARTTDPERSFDFDLTAEGATLAQSPTTAASADIELPAEALVRLVYGRLDPRHTPPVVGDLAALDRLRATFPGP
jgi:uncharacterized protein (TIGR03083 family)